MRFKGQLLLPSEPGPGLRVNLELAGHHLAVESDNGDLGAWPLAAVDVRRLEGDTFAMTVAGEDLHFVADDTIAFAYSGVPAIESVTGISRPRRRLRGLFSRFGTDSPVQLESAPMADEEQTTVAQSPAFQPEPIEAETRTREAVGAEEDEFIDMALLISDRPLEVSAEPEPTPEPVSREEFVPVPNAPSVEAPQEDIDSSLGCPALTTEGLPCRSPILASSGYCYSHDPERAVEDGYRKALEARARLKRKGTARLTKAYSRLEKAMRQVERGELEPDIAVAMAQLARTMCAILDLDDAEPEGDADTDTDLAPRF